MAFLSISVFSSLFANAFMVSSSIIGGTVGRFQTDLDSRYIDKWAETGDYFGGYGFLPFHGFRPDELEGLFGRRVKILAKTALEGFASYRGDYIQKLMRNRRRWNNWLRIHFSTCEEPETIGVSEHYMMVAFNSGKMSVIISPVEREVIKEIK